MCTSIGFLLLCITFTSSHVIINTWNFVSATKEAYKTLIHTKSPLDAVEIGASTCEVEQCDFTVGYGGSPDTNGETTLDAMIMEGKEQNTGAVGYIKHYKDAMKIARKVLEHTEHSILVGKGAEMFAEMMGFPKVKSLSTDYSEELYEKWKNNKCQPNYYQRMYNVSTQCPPYQPMLSNDRTLPPHSSVHNHDTIGMIALHKESGEMAAGASSNGAIYKIAGRIGDACIPGAGVYVDNHIGGAAATGDGDTLMRFLPAYHAVLGMEMGYHPEHACQLAIERIIKKYPDVKVGLVCLNNKGVYGGAAYGWTFTYSVQEDGMTDPKVIQVNPLRLPIQITKLTNVS